MAASDTCRPLTPSPPLSPPGVHELRLRVRQRKGDTGVHERPGHLQLRAPERAAGADGVGAQAPAAGGAVRPQPQLHQRVEGAHSAGPEVRKDICSWSMQWGWILKRLVPSTQ